MQSASASPAVAERPVRSQYEDFMRHVRDHGVAKRDRTGTGTKSVFGHQMRFDLREGFPLVTTKKVHLRSIILELLWFLRGDGNARWLQERGVTIWDEWAAADGEPRPRLRRAMALAGRRPTAATSTRSRGSSSSCKTDPDSRRIIVSAWNVAALPDMALLPCHAFFQFYVAPAAGPGERGRLSCQLYQRSADIFLGVPFNIASYALLTHMLAQQCDLDVGDFIWTGGDCHIYSNHAEQVELQLSRAPFPYPTLEHQAPAGLDLRLRVRGLRGPRLPASPGHQGARGGLSRFGRPSVVQFTTRVFHAATSGAKVSQCRRITLRRRPPSSNASGA